MSSDEPCNDSPAEQVFAEFLERLEAGESADFESVCSEHSVLTKELRRMHRRWQAMSRAFTVLSRSGDPSAVAESTSASLSALIKKLGADGKRWQRYAVGHEIATGAMGTVVRAWDEDLRRDVALKIHRHAGDERFQRRFVEEAQIAGQLDHPGIVPIHELGLDDQGSPFFAMKLVRGRDLGELIELVPNEVDGWSRTRVLNVLLRVCEAMAYAHEKGVVHRDLKPQNIMVGRFGEAYVMDWGLARVAKPDDSDGNDTAMDTVRREIEAEGTGGESPLLTRDGEVVGTPAYMSPEQADGEVDRADPAADVYAIGAMLYQLLIGHIPYCPLGSQLSAAQMLDAVRAGPPPSLPRLVPAELRAICDRAMARRANDRYPSMMALADDLRAFLESRVVSAYRTGNLAEFGKWIARNPALSISSLLLVLVLLASSIIATKLWLTAVDAREVIAVELTRGDYRNARLALRLDNSSLSEKTLWRQHLEGAMSRATYWALVENATRDPVLRSRAVPAATAVAFADTENAFVVADQTGCLQLLDSDTLALRKTIGTPGSSVVGAIATSTTQARAVAGNAKGEVVVWDLVSGAEQLRIKAHDAAVTSALMLVDGFVTGDANGHVLHVRDGEAKPQAIVQVDGVATDLAFHGGLGLLAIANDRGVLQLLALDGESRPPMTLSNHAINSLAFTQDGHQLWAGAGESIVVIDVMAGKIVRSMPASNGTCRAIACLDDGTMAVGGWWRIDHFAADGERLSPLSLNGVRSMALGKGGKRIAYTLANLVGVVDGTQRDRRVVAGRGAIALSRDGSTAVTWRNGRMVAVDVVTGDERASLPVEGGGWLRTNDDATRVAVAGSGKATIWDLQRGTSYEVAGPIDRGMGDLCLFAPGGAEFAVIAGADRVERRRSHDGELVAAYDFPGQQLLRLSYAQDGTQLAILARHKSSVSVVTLANNDVREVLFEDAENPGDPNLFAVAFDKDCSQMAVGTWRGEVRVLDMRTGALQIIQVPAGVTWAVAFSPTDENLLVVSSGSGGVTFWDLETAECCLQMLGDSAPASQLQLSDDGRTLSCFTVKGPLLVDLDYRSRHVAGGLAVQLRALRDQVMIPDGREAQLQSWAKHALEKPWPRWR